MTKGIFTLLYNRDYLPGALVLGSSLRDLLKKSEDDIKLGILIDKSQFNEYQLSMINSLYDDIVEVSLLRSGLLNKLQNELGRPDLDKTFTKVHLWSLSDYESILYLDSDTLPIVPTDLSDGSILDILKLNFPENKILAAPDSGFPDVFNSGVFALKPNPKDYEKLLSLAQSSDQDSSFDGADQGLLNQYFNTQADWINDIVSSENLTTNFHDFQSNWLRIPFLYNVTPSAQYEYLPAYNYYNSWKENPRSPVDFSVQGANVGAPSGEDTALKSSTITSARYASCAINFVETKSKIKLIHYIGPYKPWKSFSTNGIFGSWWNVWMQHYGYLSISNVVSDQNKRGGITHAKSEKQKLLLDPSTYQHVAEVPASADSLWDPSKNPPPQVKSAFIYNTRHLEEETKAFKNIWDLPRDKDAIEVNSFETNTAAENLPYKPVKAERVFHDYWEPVKKKSHAEKVFHSKRETHVENNEIAEEYNEPKPVDYEEVNKKLEQLIIDDSITVGAYRDEYHSHPRIFPWEFKSDYHKPERTFD